jgi:diguanylate cyclase (GGDEF)-like protein
VVDEARSEATAPDGARPVAPPEVPVFVARLAVMAAALLAGVSVIAYQDGVGDVKTLVAFTVLGGASGIYSVASINSGRTSFDFNQAMFIAAVLLLAPLGVVVLIALSYLVGALGALKTPLLNHAFNFVNHVASSCVGLLVFIGLQHVLGPGTAHDVVAAVAGTTAAYVLDTVCFDWRAHYYSGQPFHRALWEGFRSDAFQIASTCALGLMAGIAGGSFSWASLLAVPALATMHLVESRHHRAVRASERLDGLFRLALVAHDTVAPVEIERVVTDAAEAMLGCGEVIMSGSGPEPREIGTVITDGDPERWLIAQHPMRLDLGFSDDDRRLLEAIGTIGRSAFQNAELIEHIRWQGTHDERTGLPNQTLFDDRVAQAIGLAHRDKTQLAIMCINVDGFRKINESFGFAAGDEVLNEVADRLHDAVRDIDTIARMAADQFMLLLPSVGSPSTVRLLATRVLDVFAKPMRVGSTELFLTASAGVAIFPEHGSRSSELLRNAESALHMAKGDGGNAPRLYSPEMNEFAHLRLSRQSELHSAIERGELTVRYQPFVELVSGRSVGVEALVRWNHPLHGLLPPDEFVPLAEESGLILALDAWVMKEACRQAVKWSAMGLPALRVAVNLSGRHFHDEGIVRLVEQTLAETMLSADRLELEITERIALREGPMAESVLATLRRMGVSLSIDDFGTGYSALAQLQRLSVDRLKVDRAFIAQITRPDDPAPLVTAFLAMAKALGLEVIAEGVETVEQRDFLLLHGCQEAQGYLFAKPLPPDDLAALVGAEVLWSHGAHSG